MKTSIKRLPKSSEGLEKIIVDLTAQLANKQKIIDQSKAELSLYKEKYARLIEEIRLAKQPVPGKCENCTNADIVAPKEHCDTGVSGTYHYLKILRSSSFV